MEGLMKKKVAILSLAVILLVILLFPIRNQLKDGGSVQYKSLTYEITKVHSLIPEENAKELGKVKPYDDGYIIKILGFEIYNNVK